MYDEPWTDTHRQTLEAWATSLERTPRNLTALNRIVALRAALAEIARLHAAARIAPEGTV